MILPKRNEADLDDVPEAVREAMTFHLAADVSEVLWLTLSLELWCRRYLDRAPSAAAPISLATASLA